MTTVLAGYRTVPGATCPYCGGSYMAFEDDGRLDTVLARCWCGATARARRDDPELVAHLAAVQAEQERRVHQHHD